MRRRCLLEHVHYFVSGNGRIWALGVTLRLGWLGGGGGVYVIKRWESFDTVFHWVIMVF